MQLIKHVLTRNHAVSEYINGSAEFMVSAKEDVVNDFEALKLLKCIENESRNTCFRFNQGSCFIQGQ